MPFGPPLAVCLAPLGCAPFGALAGLWAGFGGGLAAFAIAFAGRSARITFCAGLFHAFALAGGGAGFVAVAFGVGFALAVLHRGLFLIGLIRRIGRIFFGGGGAFADLRWNFFFGGADGGEGVADQHAEREDEQGLDHGLAGGRGGDHEDALVQGGVVAHAWSQPCDGWWCEKGFLDAQQRVPVVESLGGQENGERSGIATLLTIGLEA